MPDAVWVYLGAVEADWVRDEVNASGEFGNLDVLFGLPYVGFYLAFK